MEESFIIQNIVKDDGIAANDEAYDLLQNGILVETSKGLVCMSLNDAISSDLNLSVEDLKNVATKLILQENIPKKDTVYLKTTSNLNFDSDGFSSECSDISLASGTSVQSGLITFASFSGGIASNVLKAEIKTSNTNSSSVSDSDQIANPAAIEVHKLPKRRGGWPKGRKRKPELLNLPPKAPATGYNLFLNEQRKLFKDSKLVFHEVTKLIGNKWSNLTLEEKRPYLARAEEDKRRYREELKQYRQSDAYRAYLAKKRRNKLQNNVLSESDMDATDEIDDEDNEELYCRTCDQWFHNLHNKREHLQGKQHTQSVAGDIKRELDIYNNSIRSSITVPPLYKVPENAAAASKVENRESNSNSVADSMMNLVAIVARREEEIRVLKNKLQETSSSHVALSLQLSSLKQRFVKLKQDLVNLKDVERDMEARVAHLWQVPSWFVITDFNADPAMELAHGSG